MCNQDAFFCFSKADASRAAIVIKHWESISNRIAGFISEAEFESFEQNGIPPGVNWIDQRLKSSSVTVVLVGKETCYDQLIEYEIKKSIEFGNGLIGIDISKIKDFQGNISERCGQFPDGYPFFLWDEDYGQENVGRWIEAAVHKSQEDVLSKPPTAELISDICPGCGELVDPSWLYCGYCQRGLIQSELQPRHQTSRSNLDSNGSSSGQIKSNFGTHSLLKGIVIGGIASFVVIAAYLVMYLHKGTNSSNRIGEVTPVLSTSTSVNTPTLVVASTENLTLLPTKLPDYYQIEEPVPPEELSRAEQIFMSGGKVYLFDPQPSSVSLADINSTEFSFRYILPDNSQSVPNVVFIWKVNALGNKEYVIANSGYIEDWTRASGKQTFNLFNITRDIFQQQNEYDPNKAVLQAVVGMTPLYGGLNEYYVDDPIFLEIFLVAPEDQEGTYVLSASSISLSNSLRIEITP